MARRITPEEMNDFLTTHRNSMAELRAIDERFCELSKKLDEYNDLFKRFNLLKRNVRNKKIPRIIEVQTINYRGFTIYKELSPYNTMWRVGTDPDKCFGSPETAKAFINKKYGKKTVLDPVERWA